MSFNYAGARATAENLIKKFGQAGTIIVKGVSGGYDENGDVAADTPDTTISGTITPLLQYSNKEVDGDSILKGDAYVFFHSDTAPQVNNQVVLNGKDFRIVDIISLTSVDGINVFRKIQLRG